MHGISHEENHARKHFSHKHMPFLSEPLWQKAIVESGHYALLVEALDNADEKNDARILLQSVVRYAVTAGVNSVVFIRLVIDGFVEALWEKKAILEPRLADEVGVMVDKLLAVRSAQLNNESANIAYQDGNISLASFLRTKAFLLSKSLKHRTELLVVVNRIDSMALSSSKAKMGDLRALNQLKEGWVFGDSLFSIKKPPEVERAMYYVLLAYLFTLCDENTKLSFFTEDMLSDFFRDMSSSTPLVRLCAEKAFDQVMGYLANSPNKMMHFFAIPQVMTHNPGRLTHPSVLKYFPQLVPKNRLHYTYAEEVSDAGFCGVVQRYTHDSNDYAIKQVVAGEDDAVKKAQVTELLMLSQLSHDNIIAYQGNYKPNMPGSPLPNIMLSYCVAGDLMTWLVSKPSLTPSTLATIFLGVCRALAYLHESGLVHFDVKPANILLATEAISRPDQVKLADFGLADVVGEHRLHVKGTVSYMAPEIMRRRYSENYTHSIFKNHTASDIWSLGLTLYEVLVGWLPVDRVYNGISYEQWLSCVNSQCLQQTFMITKKKVKEDKQSSLQKIGPFVDAMNSSCFVSEKNNRPSAAGLASILSQSLGFGVAATDSADKQHKQGSHNSVL